MASGDAPDPGAVAGTLGRAVGRLRSLQHVDGWWKGELETNVSIEAEDLLLRQFLGIPDDADTAATAAWIRAKQRSDGTWANFYEGPAELSTTIEAYVALRLAGDDPADAHMTKAAEFVRGAGGIEAARVFTRLWMALFGLWPWRDLPALPPEMIFLPPSVPLNIYDFACWARQTLVALTVVAAYRPVRPLPFGIEELWAVPSEDVVPAGAAGAGLVGLVRSAVREARTPARWFGVLDRVLHRYERRARGGLLRSTVREAALAAAERWIVRRQEADGSWGGIQPPWVYSIIALHMRGYSIDHPVLQKAFEGLEAFTIRENGTRRLEACQSPVWDTALAVTALRDAGVPADDPALVTAADWLVSEEVAVRGDWAVRRPELAPGGWAFEFANDNYPDIDDTAEVVLALLRAGGSAPNATAAALERGVRWTEGMVCADGGWAAFDAENTRAACRDLRFCDFGEVIDPPTADVTAHVVEMLAAYPDRDAELMWGGVEWLTREQEGDGSWFGRWGANHVYGTGAAVPALVAAGVGPGDWRVRRALRFLEEHQNEDGGWGEDLRSYRDPQWRGRGASTASQTAWALLAFVAAGEASSAAACRGVQFLLRTEIGGGGWDEPWYTGTGFPGDFYINYHLYRLVFPVSALGRWLAAVMPPGSAPAVRQAR
jgi:squalene-hopene/tetraprenyl-beta-curcumene cyclase